VDRRYRQSRTYDGTRANVTGSARREAYARAQLARGRVSARSARSGGNERGPKSIDPQAAISILRGRAAQVSDRNRVFQEEGSGVYGGAPALEDARRQEEEDFRGLLPGIG